MPGYQFQDSENQAGAVPPGDYTVEVVEVEFGISNGAKTSGADKMSLKLKIDGKATCFEHLIFHPSCIWKIDTAIKSLNLLINGKPPKKGESIQFSEPMMLGLRGWATIGQEPDKNKVLRNKVVCWITTKEKLAKVEQPTQEPKPTEEDDDDVPF